MLIKLKFTDWASGMAWPTRTATALLGEVANDTDISEEVRTVIPSSLGEGGRLVLAMDVAFFPWLGEPLTVY